ncbi:unnamed protein product [Onchocerca flexuosa]|uniref:Annexin n=1 Tax=Onchocerca flexuosa TaxID=387005 RepID=A0A183HHU7_9BILA|nr:unnamed protein product [Onchocerca flexuosa]
MTGQVSDYLLQKLIKQSKYTRKMRTLQKKHIDFVKCVRDGCQSLAGTKPPIQEVPYIWTTTICSYPFFLVDLSKVQGFSVCFENMSEEEIKTAKSSAAVSDNEYPKILESYRQKWVRNLGIQNKPSVSCQKISCQKNKRIHTSCLKILDRCPSGLRNNDLEAVLTMFCEREECDFDESYASILEMLVPLRCTLDELYNIFYAITTKFVPRFFCF